MPFLKPIFFLFLFLYYMVESQRGGTMDKLKLILIRILAVLTTIVVAVGLLLAKVTFYNPTHLQVRYETIVDSKIPSELKNLTVVYFTDLQYGQFQDDKRMEQLVDKINELSPQVIIFGGDLYDTTAKINKKTNKKMIKWLSKLNAPFGKYAVYGEKDLKDEETKETVKSIYKASQFELLTNSSVHIGLYTRKGIRLIGFSSNPNYEKALQNVISSEYNIVVTHKPDNLLDESLSSISLGLAGHSHGTQITYPIIGPYRTIKGASKLNRSQKASLPFLYIISSGVGCTKVDARLNADPEIYYIVFKNK